MKTSGCIALGRLFTVCILLILSPIFFSSSHNCLSKNFPLFPVTLENPYCRPLKMTMYIRLLTSNPLFMVLKTCNFFFKF